jgi:hypothetical protein
MAHPVAPSSSAVVCRDYRGLWRGTSSWSPCLRSSRTGKLRFLHGMAAAPWRVWLYILLAPGQRQLLRGGDAPRRAIEAADRVVDSILATNRKERGEAREWRGTTRGGELGRRSRGDVVTMCQSPSVDWPKPADSRPRDYRSTITIPLLHLAIHLLTSSTSPFCVNQNTATLRLLSSSACTLHFSAILKPSKPDTPWRVHRLHASA